MQIVIAVSAIEFVIAVLPVELVIAITAIKFVCSCTAVKLVVAAASGKSVIAVITAQHVVAVLCDKHIIPGSTINLVISAAAVQIVIAFTTMYIITAFLACYDIVTFLAIEFVVAISPGKDIIACAAQEGVIAITSIGEIITRVKVDFIVPSPCIHFFSMIQPPDDIGILGTVDDLFVQVIVVQPCGEIAEVCVLVSVFIQYIVSFNFKPEMINTVGNRVDEIVAPEPYVAAVVLYEVESRFLAVFIISVQLNPLFKMVFADIGIDGPHIVNRDVPIIGNTGIFNGFDDDAVHCICIIRTCIDIVGICISCQPRVAFNSVSEFIETGAGIRLIDIEVLYPACKIVEAGISVAVFIEDVISFNVKPEVVDAVGNRIYEILAEHPCRCAIVLYKVES